MADSYSKKENNKKKIKKQQDKLLRRTDRKVNNNKGKSLEEMLVYLDVNGNLTSIPPHLQPVETPIIKKRDNSSTDSNSEFNQGIITYINEKGFGFITENSTRDNVYFHFDPNNTLFKKTAKVTYKKESSSKGFRAIDIVLI